MMGTSLPRFYIITTPIREDPSGKKRTTRGGGPLRPADPLKYKHVSKYNFEMIGFECKS